MNTRDEEKLKILEAKLENTIGFFEHYYKQKNTIAADELKTTKIITEYFDKIFNIRNKIGEFKKEKPADVKLWLKNFCASHPGMFSIML